MRLTRLLVLAAAAPLALACERERAPAAPAPAHAATARDAGATADGAMSEPPVVLPPPPTDVFAPPADAEREPNGVARKILARGSGTKHPDVKASFVDLRYSGWERNGRQFEGSPISGAPARFDPAELTDGLRDELAKMVEGDKRRLWVPAALAYAKRTNFANAPKGDMTFEVELVRIVSLPPTPKHLSGPPPKDEAPTKTTKSGLVYQVLDKGTGKKHPTDETRAEVIYCGWSADGHMFQTSLSAADTGTVRVKLLPQGWREAMALMVEGDRWRLWLPGKLAFGDLPPGQEALPFGPPPGPVVYEVTLLKILE